MPSPHSFSATPPPRSSSRIPHAGRDPICSAGDALAVFSLQLTHPLSHETLVMFIDASGCGISLVTVSDTVVPDQVLDVVDTMAMLLADRPNVSGMVVASVRPRGGILADDDTLWFEATEAVESHGLALFDWLIIGRGGTRSMSDELGVPSRWPSRT